MMMRTNHYASFTLTVPTILPTSSLFRLSEFVVTQTGLYFQLERGADLERAIVTVALDFNFSDRESCAEWLLSAV